jgi:hypothetical protein
MKMTVFWDVAGCSLVETDRVSEMLIATIIRAMMEAVSTSEMSVSFYGTTSQKTVSHLHT